MLKHNVIISAEKNLCGIIPKERLNGCRILVGLSGGADSVTLAKVLCTLSEKYGFSVCACHVNHMIRGAEADRDEMFVRELCKKLGIELLCKSFDVPKIATKTKKSLEEAARDVRYSYFDEICKSEKADYIATAHTASDNAETVLFNLTRGCGLSGLCGIPIKRGIIIRPLLNVTREEIEDYLGSVGQSYVTDSTNLEDDCSRNIIRHNVIPHLRGINPAFHRQISALCEIASRENNYLDKIAWQSRTDDIMCLARLDDVILSRVIGLMYKEKTGNLPGMTHIDILCSEIKKAAMKNSGEQKSFDLPGNIRAKFECGKLKMYSQNETDTQYSEYSIVPKEGVNLICGDKIIAVYREKCENNEKFCDKLEYNKNIYSLFMETKLFSDIIKGKICLRSGQPGDKIRISGMSKDIKKMFSAKKIPTSQRKYLPRITDSETGEILALPYVGVCDSQHDYYDKADISIGLYIMCGKE